MSATFDFEDPTTVRELTRYVEHAHPDLRASYNDRHKQLIVVGQPGRPEPPAELREIIGGGRFELRAHAVADRGRWVGVVNAADDGGNQ